MATSENVLFEINSTNYNNSDVFLMYKPQVGYSGFVTTLRITVNLKSIEEANFPHIPDDTPADVLQEILDRVALNTPFKEVILFFKKGTGSWVERAPIKIYNKDPYYDVNLMRLFSDSNTIDVSEDFSLGIRLKLGDTLTATDKILVWGSAVEEKKNNGNEELAARIEALELALAGRLTNLPANTLLGNDKNTTSGIAEAIPQSNFAKPADIDTAIFNLIGGAPGALNTLDELAQALADDANFAATITNLLATKVSLTGNQIIDGFKTFNNNLRLNGTFASTDHFGASNTGSAGFQAGLDIAGNVSLSLFGGQAGKVCYFDFAVSPGADFDARILAQATEISFQTSNSYYFNIGTRLKAFLPTSPTGLPTGAIWRNGTVLNIV